MKQKTVLFDLDGTLLPMDQDAFTKGYFTLLVQKLAPHGYDPAALVDNIWAGTAVMVANDGSTSMGKKCGKTSPYSMPSTGRSFSRPRRSAAKTPKPGKW